MYWDETYETIELNRGDSVLTVTLNRPERLNAFNFAMTDELCQVLDEAAVDGEVDVIVVKGAGRAFSSGADINTPDENLWLQTDDGLQMYQRFDRGYTSRWLDSVWDNPKPVIAQVHGYCLGQAVDFVNSCDLVVAADDALFGLPEARFGGILMAFLPWVVGIHKAKEMMFLGENITGVEAKRIGMVNDVVAADVLESTVQTLAANLAKVPTETLYFSKKAINSAMEAGGFRQGVRNSFALNTLSKLTEGGAREWSRIRKEKGHKEALKWRDRHLSS